MTTYIVTFDVDDEKSIKKIEQALTNFGFYCPIHSNAWAICSNKSAIEVRDEVGLVIESGRIFVIRSGTEAAWYNSYGEKNDEWLKKNL